MSDNNDCYNYNSLTPNEKQKFRKAIAKKSIENFIKLYLPHHFSFEEEIIKKINKKIKNKIDLSVANKVVFNKTSLPTFEIYNEAINNTNINYALGKARGFGKTTEIFALILHCLSFQTHKFIIYINETLDKAIDMVRAIVDEIESNELLVLDFPHLKPKRSDLTKKQASFTQKNIIFESGTRLMAASTFTSLRGRKHGKYRPDLVICDDLETDEHVMSRDQRKKTEKWFRKQIMPLGGGAGCSLIVVGTIIDYNSLMADLVFHEKFKDFKVRLFPAIDKETGESNWQEVWTLERLNIEKERLGVGAFSSEYLCNPLPEEQALFTKEIVDRGLFNLSQLENLDNIFGYIDIAEVGTGDYTAITIGAKQNAHIYVVDAFIKKININNLIPIVGFYVEKWKVHTLGVESNNNKFFIEELKKYLINEKNIGCNVVGIHHTTNKKQRIATLVSPLLQAGLLHFLENYEERYPQLIEQLLGFPVWSYDDAPDSLAGLLEIEKKYAIPYMDFSME